MNEIRKTIKARLDHSKAMLEIEQEEETAIRGRLRKCVEHQARLQLEIIEFEDFLSGSTLAETEGVRP